VPQDRQVVPGGPGRLAVAAGKVLPLPLRRAHLVGLNTLERLVGMALAPLERPEPEELVHESLPGVGQYPAGLKEFLAARQRIGPEKLAVFLRQLAHLESGLEFRLIPLDLPPGGVDAHCEQSKGVAAVDVRPADIQQRMAFPGQHTLTSPRCPPVADWRSSTSEFRDATG